VRTRVLISLAAAVFILGANGAAHARRVSNHVSYSLTRAWAGFVERADGRAFTGVRATWTLPRIVCNQPSSSVAFWVGLGGATSSSRALEQIGTTVDCSDRAAVSYSAWYEAYPARAVDLPLVVRRGDTVTAEVRVAGKRVAVTLVNDSTGVSFAKHFTMPAPEADSAEWIAEAPSSCVSPLCAPLPLAHFGRVTFVSATATVLGQNHPLADPRLQTQLVAVAHRGRIAARPVAPRPLLSAGSVLG
jgi:peptidase A4-like protein